MTHECFACDEQEASGVRSPTIEHTCVAVQHGPLAGVETPAADRALGLANDADLGAFVVGCMCVGAPSPDNFAALGRILRAGSREDLEAALRRRAR